MKIKPGFVMREIAGQYIAIATGKASESFHGMIKINETGAVVWRGIEDGLDADQIADSLVSAYGIEKEKALRDVSSCIDRFVDAGIAVR